MYQTMTALGEILHRRLPPSTQVTPLPVEPTVFHTITFTRNDFSSTLFFGGKLLFLLLLLLLLSNLYVVQALFRKQLCF